MAKGIPKKLKSRRGGSSSISRGKKKQQKKKDFFPSSSSPSSSSSSSFVNKPTTTISKPSFSVSTHQHHRVLRSIAHHVGVSRWRQKEKKNKENKEENKEEEKRRSNSSSSPLPPEAQATLQNMEENQALNWEGLKPGTKAPISMPEGLEKMYAAGNALVTMITATPELIASAALGHMKGYPGSNYIGPGTDLTTNLKPTSQMDDLARIHDWQYSQLEAQGVNPYFTFNLADRYMLAHADLTTAEGWAIYVGIGLKQIFPDDYTGIEPVPLYKGAGEDPTVLSEPQRRIWENYGIDRLAMMEKIQQVSQQLTHPSLMTQEEKTPFISSLLGALTTAKETLQQVAQVGAPPPQPRDFGKDPFLRRFFLGDSTTGTITGGPSAIARRVLSTGLSSSSSALRFLPMGQRFSLSSARNSVATVASRENKSVSSLAHPQQKRDYKRNMYTQPNSLFSSQNGRSVPSFVKH